jgi:hypothetical protein
VQASVAMFEAATTAADEGHPGHRMFRRHEHLSPDRHRRTGRATLTGCAGLTAAIMSAGESVRWLCRSTRRLIPQGN